MLKGTRTMKVFVRSKNTRLYLAESNGWASKTELARQFASIPHAARFVRDECMMGVEGVLLFELLREEIAVPLVSAWCDYEPRAAT